MAENAMYARLKLKRNGERARSKLVACYTF